MSDYLHWIGRQYYSPIQFAKEAKKEGVTRRVALKTLRGMAWGDRVYLIGRKNKQIKSGQIFGVFQIQRILGMPEEITAHLVAENRAVMTDLGGRVVHRGCGDYVEGPTYQVSASIGELIHLLEEVDEKATLMVGGAFVPVDPPVRMKDIPFQMGFRRFNGEEFERQRAEGKEGKEVMSGMFYTDFLPQDDQPAPCEGEATVLVDYERKR